MTVVPAGFSRRLEMENRQRTGVFCTLLAVEENSSWHGKGRNAGVKNNGKTASPTNIALTSFRSKQQVIVNFQGIRDFWNDKCKRYISVNID